MMSESPDDGARANFLVWLRSRASSVTELHTLIGNAESDNNSSFLIEQLCLALTNALLVLRINQDSEVVQGMQHHPPPPPRAPPAPALPTFQQQQILPG